MDEVEELRKILPNLSNVSSDMRARAVNFVKKSLEQLGLLAEFSSLFWFDITIPYIYSQVFMVSNEDVEVQRRRVLDAISINRASPYDILTGIILVPKSSPYWHTVLKLYKDLPATEKYQAPQSSSPTMKEPAMQTQATVNMFRQLAKKDVQVDDLTALVGKISPDLESALKEMQAAEEQEKAKSDAKVIFEVLKSAQAHIDNRVAALRQIRKQEVAEKAKIMALDRARAYAMESKDFLPLLALVDGTVPGATAEELTVPEDWKSATATPQA